MSTCVLYASAATSCKRAVPVDGYIYATETSRGLLIFRELP
jgi:hypothetical protein